MKSHSKESAPEIKLPIIKGKIPEPKSVSMDDYLRFVEFNLKYVVNLKECRKQKRASAVNVLFEI